MGEAEVKYEVKNKIRECCNGMFGGDRRTTIQAVGGKGNKILAPIRFPSDLRARRQVEMYGHKNNSGQQRLVESGKGFSCFWLRRLGKEDVEAAVRDVYLYVTSNQRSSTKIR